jgi:hypothetical protein
MKHNDLFSVSLVTGYLFIYCVLSQIEAAFQYTLLMFLFSPVLVIWMVYTVLKHGVYNGPSLGNKEFGYQDRNPDESNVV